METKRVYNHQATSAEDSTRNSVHRRRKQTKHKRTGSIKPQEKKRQAFRE
jgi:hypothetical protein